MFLKSLLINGIILAFFVQQSIGNRKCYEAKTCIHNNKEKCGRDKNGKVRRFIDTCDMLEYNCLRGTDYVKIDLNKCKYLPLIEDKAAGGIDQESGDFAEKDDGKETNAQESASDNDEVTENNLAAESDVSKGDVSVSIVVPESDDHNGNVEETNVVPGSAENNDENPEDSLQRH